MHGKEKKKELAKFLMWDPYSSLLLLDSISLPVGVLNS
jgi:hypothetical protein